MGLQLRFQPSPKVIIGGVVTAVLLAGAVGAKVYLNHKRAQAAAEQAYTLTPITVDQLQGGQYYAGYSDGTYYALPLGAFMSTVKDDTIIATAANPNTRIDMFGKDDEAIPTIYKDSMLIYKAGTSQVKKNQNNDEVESPIPSSFTLERFKDEGWSIGVRGLTAGQGTERYKVVVDGTTFYPGSSIAALNCQQGDEITFDKITGTPVNKANVSTGGTITGLEKGKSYSVDAYKGTEYIGIDAVADTHMFTSYELYNFTDYSPDPNNYIVIDLPDYLQSGYYMINGAGMFKYIARTRSEGTTGIEMNTPYFMGVDESGNQITNPAGNNTETTTEDAKKTSTDDFVWTNDITIDNQQKELSVTVVYSDASAIVNGTLLTEKDGTIPGATTPTAVITAPDGTEYPLTGNSDDSDDKTPANTLSVKVENPGTGTWHLSIKGMYARTFDINTDFTGTAQNMIVKNGDQDTTMTVYVSEAIPDGYFKFTWEDKSHAGQFEVLDDNGQKYIGTETTPDHIISQTYGETNLYIGKIDAKEYKIVVKGESLGHVYFSAVPSPQQQTK